MYPIVLFFHSLLRWLVVGSLLYAVISGLTALKRGARFTAWHNATRHITATIAHIQLVVGYLLYFQSPLIAYFRSHYSDVVQQIQYSFFGLVHIILMTLAVILITIGSSLAKRRETDPTKFRTMIWFFSLGLLIIFIAIPWPFSPFAARPYFRPL